MTPRLFFLAATIFVGCTAPADRLETALVKADSLIMDEVEAGNISGAVLLVSTDGRIKHLKAFGYAQQFQYGGAKMPAPIPMETSQVFDLASLTKVFATTFGIMSLVDEGRVALDAPVKTYLPAFSGASKDSVTVRHLLSHTSGLHPWKPTYYHASNKEESLNYIAGLDLAYPVGAGRRYSDLGFMLLGYIIESVSGQTLESFLQDSLYNPLQLQNTGYTLAAPLNRFAATSHGNPFEKRMVADDNFGYVCDEDPDAFTGWRQYVLVGEVNDGNAFHAHEGTAGHAGLFSTAEDLHVLLNLLLEKGSFNGKQLIAQSTIDAFLSMDQAGNGLGWAMSPGGIHVEDPPAGTFGHTGFTGTYALGVPAQGLGLILLTNRQHGGVNEDGRYPSLTNLRKSVAEVAITALQ